MLRLGKVLADHLVCDNYIINCELAKANCILLAIAKLTLILLMFFIHKMSDYICIYSNPFQAYFITEAYTKNPDQIWPRGYKTFFVLNSAEHEISTAHKN